MVRVLVLALVRRGMSKFTDLKAVLSAVKWRIHYNQDGVVGDDIGWAGAFVPMIVGTETLRELRNLAGPPPTPGMKIFEVNLESGQAKWKVWKAASPRRYSRRRR